MNTRVCKSEYIKSPLANDKPLDITMFQRFSKKPISLIGFIGRGVLFRSTPHKAIFTFFSVYNLNDR